MKDEQLNVTPNFYTYDSSKIKVGSSTIGLESEKVNYLNNFRLEHYHKDTSAYQSSLTVSALFLTIPHVHKHAYKVHIADTNAYKVHFADTKDTNAFTHMHRICATDTQSLCLSDLKS